MDKLIIRKSSASDIQEIVELTKMWEKEQITFGLKCDSNDYVSSHISWVAVKNKKVIGFLFGNIEKAKKMSITDKKVSYFEVEEAYVIPEYRSNGIGEKLFSILEDYLNNIDVPYYLLSTATKDYDSILNFYVNKQNMSVWNIRLFKKLSKTK